MKNYRILSSPGPKHPLQNFYGRALLQTDNGAHAPERRPGFADATCRYRTRYFKP